MGASWMVVYGYDITYRLPTGMWRPDARVVSTKHGHADSSPPAASSAPLVVGCCGVRRYLKMCWSVSASNMRIHASDINWNVWLRCFACGNGRWTLQAAVQAGIQIPLWSTGWCVCMVSGFREEESRDRQIEHCAGWRLRFLLLLSLFLACFLQWSSVGDDE